MLLNQSLALLMLGVPHGNGDDPRTLLKCLEGVRIKFQMTNLTIPNNFPFMKYAPKSVPGLGLMMLGSFIRMGMAPELQPDVWQGSGIFFK